MLTLHTRCVLFTVQQGKATSHLQARRAVRQRVPQEGARGDPPTKSRKELWRVLRPCSTQGLLCHPSQGVRRAIHPQ